MATCTPPDRHGNKDNELIGLHNMPIIDTPWSWVSDHWWTHQSGPCAQDEYYFTKCVGHVGVARAPVECKKLHDDFLECVFRVNTLKRYSLMQKQRKKLGLPFQERPPNDSYRSWFKDD